MAALGFTVDAEVEIIRNLGAIIVAVHRTQVALGCGDAASRRADHGDGASRPNRRTHPVRPRHDLGANTGAGSGGAGLARGGRYPQTLETYDTKCICRWSHIERRKVDWIKGMAEP
jgi:hypothetical protein